MYKIKYYIEKYKFIIILIFAILILMIGIILNFIDKKNIKVEEYQINEIEDDTEKQEENIVDEEYKVDIKGMVENPGVYKLKSDSRVIDVISKAGGLKEDANTEYLNLSKKIVDEMVIIVYSNNDVEKFKEEDKQIIYIEYECICPDNKNEACINENDTVNTNGVTDKVNDELNSDSLISINTATIEELMTLSGIGESKAKAIIEYRNQNGEFKSLEDIMNISGIGESVYSKIKDYIKL